MLMNYEEMVPSGYESDVIQWGLRLLDGDSVFNSGYYGEMTALNGLYPENYYRDRYNLESNCVENDEIIARVLQENLCHLSIAESSGYPLEREAQLQASIYSTDWHNPLPRSNGSESLYVEEDAGTLDPSSSCSSPGDRDFSYSYAVDDEEFWRFNQMIPVPHVPKINGEIPSVDEAASDHQRLLNRLQVYDFVERKVEGDGNCQFRALSDQLYGTPENHELVRQKVVNRVSHSGKKLTYNPILVSYLAFTQPYLFCLFSCQKLMSHPEIYEGYVPMAYDDYLEKMSRDGEWGDHVTLQAAVDSYGVRIFVITSFKDTCWIEILPNSQKTKGVIFLSFWAEVHYNSIHPQGGVPSSGDSPPSELRKKRRWWRFGNKH